MTNSLCKIQLLGGLRVQIGEREITRFSRQKTASLLAYLAFYRHQNHPREVLMEMLWPECEPEAGRGRLRITLWSLRRQLEVPGIEADALLQTAAFSIGLHSSLVTTDVAEFFTALRQAARASSPEERIAHLQQAVALYAGELLPGYYEDWVLREQRRLTGLYEKVVRYLSANSSQTEEMPFLLLPETTTPTSTMDADAVFTLPLSFTRFFGRKEELTRLQEMLSPLSPMASRSRLITITGTGGTGKTRLSLEVARRLVDTYSGSVWFAPLADLRDPALIGSSLVDVLSLPRSGNLDPLEQVICFFKESQESPSLIVLDNFEQLVEGGAEIVQTLLGQVPALTLLVTSRRLLHLSAEREFALRPLPTPQGDESLERLTLYESVQLFIDRAQNARPDFQVTNKNAPAVAELCHRLEGIPLALELAAARALMLTPAQMLSQMERRFVFLVSKKRDVVARHRTLQAAIEWSYRLLSPQLQQFFVRLSVFRGGWTLEAAEAVCEEPQALEYLEQLREWSLVLCEESEIGMRYRMLDTLRECAEAQPLDGNRTKIRENYAMYFFQMTEEAEAGVRGQNQGMWLKRLESEYDNLRAALTWFHTEKAAETGLRFVSNLYLFWYICNYAKEGYQQIGNFLNLESAQQPTHARSLALIAASALAFQIDNNLAAEAFSEEALTICRTLNDTLGVSRCLHGLAMGAEWRGDFRRAIAIYEECLALKRERKDRTGVVAILHNLGKILHDQGDMILARQRYEESLAISRDLGDIHSMTLTMDLLGILLRVSGDYSAAEATHLESLELSRGLGDKRGSASSLHCLGNVHLDRKDYITARDYYTESLKVQQEVGSKMSIVELFLDMGLLALESGRMERSVQLCAATEALRESIASPIPTVARQEFEYQIATARQRLEEENFEAAWKAGRAMTWEQAIAYALEET